MAMSVRTPPQHAQILVIGGGPAGSYTASVLAREGMHVVLCEGAQFPRYHIGESLIPYALHLQGLYSSQAADSSVRPYLRFIGAEEKVKNHGFFYKPGAAIKFNQFKKEGYTDFVALGAANSSWNVVRAEFDQLLLDHSKESGVDVYESTQVTSLETGQDDALISASWSISTTGGNDVVVSKTGKIMFDYLVDASGRNGVMSTKYLKNRKFNAALKNIAAWAYWRHCGCYGLGTSREGAPYFEALEDGSGWAWFIPLPGEVTSVGVVMNQEVYNKKTHDPTSPCAFSDNEAPNPTNSGMVSKYLANLSLAPTLVALMGDNATMELGSTKMASDFSYTASRYAGRNFRIVGDAGAFIDPFFSSGIHLACTSALSAALSLCAAIRGDCSADEAGRWHTARFATSYARFQLVVLSAYKQFRCQNHPILSDIDEDNYDRAFRLFRPVIQGAAEVGQLSEDELQKAVSFCMNIFNPTSPEQHRRLLEAGILTEELLDIHGPMAGVTAIQNHFSEECECSEAAREEGEMVLKKINARKVVHMEYGIGNLETEALHGLVAKLHRGSLGLRTVE